MWRTSSAHKVVHVSVCWWHPSIVFHYPVLSGCQSCSRLLTLQQVAAVIGVSIHLGSGGGAQSAIRRRIDGTPQAYYMFGRFWQKNSVLMFAKVISAGVVQGAALSGLAGLVIEERH